MRDNDAAPLCTRHPLEIEALLPRFLSSAGVVQLCCSPGGESWPVAVTPNADDGLLRVDVTAIEDRIPLSDPGLRIALIHDDGGSRVRTGELPVLRQLRVRERLYLLIPQPAQLEQRQRRDSFRARLRQDMQSHVELTRDGQVASGHLVDISLGGCLVACAPSAMRLAESSQEPMALGVRFPDGTALHLHVVACHRRVAGQHLLIGLRFLDAQAHRQQIWAIVHEVERNAARSVASGSHQQLQRSRLFTGEALADLPAESTLSYRTAMAERLTPVVLFLLTQVLRLRDGDDVDGSGLAEAAELLLQLQRADRQGLLYALACLQDQPPSIAHALSVAVRLVDLGAALGQPQDTLKAVAGAGLIHDLGKVLLPPVLLDATALDAEQERLLQSHVRLILERLQGVDWIPADILEAVVAGCNERLDGTGYPKGRAGAEMTGLMKLAAVIDVADAMGRPGLGGEPQPLSAICAHLQQASQQFDSRWVEQYVAHFGQWPVGCLVSFSKGQVGWVEVVDAEGRPTSVRPYNSSNPSADSALASVSGQDLLYWGAPRATLRHPAAVQAVRV